MLVSEVQLGVKDFKQGLIVPNKPKTFGSSANQVSCEKALYKTLRKIDKNELADLYSKLPEKSYLYLQVRTPEGYEFRMISEGNVSLKGSAINFSPKKPLHLPAGKLVIVTERLRRHYKDEFSASMLVDDVLENNNLIKTKMESLAENKFLIACKETIDEIKSMGFVSTFPSKSHIAFIDINGERPEILCFGEIESSAKKELLFKWRRWTNSIGKESKDRIKTMKGGNFEGIVAVPVTTLKKLLGIEESIHV